jgi:hypothetical protein
MPKPPSESCREHWRENPSAVVGRAVVGEAGIDLVKHQLVVIVAAAVRTQTDLTIILE